MSPSPSPFPPPKAPLMKGTLVFLNKSPAHFTIQLISDTKDDLLETGHTPSPEGESTIVIYFNWSILFGIPAAFKIFNHDPKNPFFLVSLTLDHRPDPHDPFRFSIHFDCNSWVYPEYLYETPRIFFLNRSYLPSETPEGLRKYREQELKALRGYGTGQRRDGERIYDYATYNDLGNPDEADRLARPVLGGSREYPYPRRGRTGRPPTRKDPNSESALPGDQGLQVYVPRDDKFSDQKLKEFQAYFPKSGINALKPFVKNAVEQQGNEFKSYEDMRDILFKNGFTFPVPPDGKLVLKFPIPSVIQDNLDGWITDQEFGREMLAGVNPNLIRLLKDFPPQVSLDAKVYGDQSTKITKEHLEKNLDGLSVDEALIRERLFILDHHDSLMPYLRRINEIEFEDEISNRGSYATRTILFLQDDGTLKPLAIELSLAHPDGDQFGAVREVYTPEDGPLWLLAKGYVIVNDSSYHQLVSHWLNTHAVVEPFVISANRQLSALHPIYKLLHPHFKDTMFINALARQILINAEGIIETSFLLGKYGIEFTSMHYKNWVFPEQALPTDLIKRGMAVEDKNEPYGLRLLIKDYPYAVDGLEIWAAIEKWVKDYIESYYESDDTIKKDSELQAWWKELVEVGHGDLKDKPWWPKMQTRKELIDSCTIIIWISSALHAAINFGQFPYGGYIVNRPTLSRRLIPKKGTPEYDELVKNPEVGFLKTITPKLETLLDLSIIEILSGHTSDEVYLGNRNSHNWTSDLKPFKAFEEFGNKLAEIEDKIISRNNDPELKNRRGPINLPYTLLYRSSEPGMTFKGIPNSISI